MAEAESWAAVWVDIEPGFPRPRYVPTICSGLGVGYLPVITDDRLLAGGVQVTLWWLLGLPSGSGLAPPPLLVPARRPDGSIPTPDELYAAALAAPGGWVPLPEKRGDLRLRCEMDVTRAMTTVRTGTRQPSWRSRSPRGLWSPASPRFPAGRSLRGRRRRAVVARSLGPVSLVKSPLEVKIMSFCQSASQRLSVPGSACGRSMTSPHACTPAPAPG
jgi:hypothetical protein